MGKERGAGPEVADLFQVDTKTGEVREGVLVLVPKKKPNFGGFVMVWQAEALERLAMDKDLTLSTHRVLWGIISRLDYENYIQLDQTKLAGELGLAREVVNRQLKLLVEKGILEKGPHRTFRLCDRIGWRGKTTNLAKERARRIGGLKVINGGLSADVSSLEAAAPQEQEVPLIDLDEADRINGQEPPAPGGR
jgi:DNA-binding MarR family transcriptional regulator